MPTVSERWYFDSSAITKLVLREPESSALEAASTSVGGVTSIVGVIECRRSVWRAASEDEFAARLEEVLEKFSVVPLDSAAVGRAARMTPRTLRTLDAIHLATALQLGSAVSAFVTYDIRQAQSASNAGLSVLTPE